MQKTRFSAKIESLSPSMTLEVAALASQLRQEGTDVISFATGEPDYDTPEHIKNAAREALDQGFTKYTTVSGILDLKKAIARKLETENNLFYSPDEIVVTNGAKQGLFNAIQTVCSEGDQVLLPTPCWVSYVEQVKLAGAVPVLLETSPASNYELDPVDLEKTITSRTKAIILNSPNNPSGAVYSETTLRALADIAVAHKIWVISDEVYEYLTYDGARHFSPGALNGGLKDYSIVVNSLSKSFAMTGWRIGYTASPLPAAKRMAAFQGHVTGNVNAMAQRAAVAALSGNTDFRQAMITEYRKRRDFCVDYLNTYPRSGMPARKGSLLSVFRCISFLKKGYRHGSRPGQIYSARGTCGHGTWLFFLFG